MSAPMTHLEPRGVALGPVPARAGIGLRSVHHDALLAQRPAVGFIEAHTESWATDCHFLLASVEGRRMTVRAIGAMDDPSGVPDEIARFDPGGNPVSGPVVIEV